MKYLLLLLVVAVAVWWLRMSQRVSGPKKPKAPRPDQQPAAVTPMLACAHCGVHLPQAEVVTDGEGRPYCGEAHRLAGPR